MKRLCIAFALFFAGGLLLSDLPARQLNNSACEMLLENPPGNLPWATTKAVLKECAKQEQMPFGQLMQKYNQGKVAITDLGGNTYELRIELGGGNILVVLIDAGA